MRQPLRSTFHAPGLDKNLEHEMGKGQPIHHKWQ